MAMDNNKNQSIQSFIIELLMITAIVFTLDSIFILRYGFKISLSHWIIAFFNVMIVVSVLSFIKSYKKRFITYLIFILIMFLFFVTDSILYFFKNDVTSIAMLLESFRNTMKIGLKYNPLYAYSLIEWVLIFTFVFVMSILLRVVVKKSDHHHVHHIKTEVACLIVAFFGLFLAPSVINQDDQTLFNTPSDKALFVQKFGSITYHVKDLVAYTQNAIKPLIYKDDYVLDINHVLTDEFAEMSPRYGQFEGMNLIMIMCETCEEYGFSPEYTPNYYRLRDESIFFTQFFSAAKSNYTYDAEFKSLTSMMYYQSDNYMYTYGDNFYPSSLPNMLKREGYTTHSFHNYFGEFFNRDVMHLSLGFESLSAFEELGIEEDDSWPRDSIMFDVYKDLIVPVQNEPFFSFILTVTPHGPHSTYRENLSRYYDILDQDPRYKDESIEFKTLTAAQMDFDEGLGILLDDLELKGLMDETVIIIYSDHKNYSSQSITEEKTPDSDIPYEIEKVPFLIYAPGLDVGENSLVSSHYDITPTVLDLLGITYYQDLYYGESVFSENRRDKPIILSYSNWITKTYRVQFDSVVFGEVSEEDFYETKDDIYQTIQHYEKIFFSDYFRTENPFYRIHVKTDENE